MFPGNMGDMANKVITDAIADARKKIHAEREAFTQKTAQDFAAKFPGYNVMVVHTKHTWYKGDGQFRHHQHVEFPWGMGSYGYEIYLCKKGTTQYFRNLGDGGYINWCFIGNFQREGKWVTFY